MSGDNYTIRPPQTQQEWDALPPLLLDYSHEFDDDTCFTTFDAEMADIRNVYTAEGSHMILALENSTNNIVGCVAMRTLSPGVSEMKRLYVIPSHRGNGLGKKLALTIMDYAENHHYTIMLLDTMHQMQSAQALYRQLGFHVVDPYNDQDPVKVVCYEKKFS